MDTNMNTDDKVLETKMQNLENAMFSLYNEGDIEIYRKPRLNSRETMDEKALSRKIFSSQPQHQR